MFTFAKNSTFRDFWLQKGVTKSQNGFKKFLSLFFLLIFTKFGFLKIQALFVNISTIVLDSKEGQAAINKQKSWKGQKNKICRDKKNNFEIKKKEKKIVFYYFRIMK